MDQSEDQHVLAAGLHHLPLRVRDSSTCSSHSTSTKSSALTGSTLFHPQAQHSHAHSFHSHHHQFKEVSSSSSSLRSTHRRCPETLNLLSGGAVSRLRSPTESSLGSCSIPDSATTTTYSPSTLASPLSSSYASDLQDMLAGVVVSKGSRPGSRVLHRHRPSTATCSTFVNDEDEVPVMIGYQDHLKRATICRDDCESEDEDMEVTPHGNDTLPMR